MCRLIQHERSFIYLLIAQIKVISKRSQRATVHSAEAAGPTGREATSEKTTEASGLSVGTTVAVYLPQYRDELPLIGKIVDVDPTAGKVTLHWYVGSYHTVECGSLVEGEKGETTLTGRKQYP